VLKVLIVDDHASFRASARALLESEGFDVVGDAEDGQTALAAADRLHPDLVLLDVNLPDMDGFDVAKRLRTAGNTCAIVLTSSHDSSDYGPLIDRSGARGFIPKASLSAEAITELVS
jgi:DNA-binding NarL/FixJ family response regulator